MDQLNKIQKANRTIKMNMRNRRVCQICGCAREWGSGGVVLEEAAHKTGGLARIRGRAISFLSIFFFFENRRFLSDFPVVTNRRSITLFDKY